MSHKALPVFLTILLGGCSAIVNPSGAPFGEDGGTPTADSAAGDSGATDSSAGDSATTDSGRVDSSVDDSGTTDSGTLDSGTGCPGGCDDGLSCTVDSCVTGGCQHTLNDALCDDSISCTVDRCDAVDDCINTPNDGLCNDGYCFSGGRCDVGRGGCVGGDVARDCRDGDACTSDTCDPVAMMCVNDPRDDDGDGHSVDRVSAGGFPPGGTRDCGGDDCDDGDPSVFPGATEVCNGVDDNCDGTVDEGCPAPPDDCGSAQAIPLSAGAGSAAGNFGALGNDYGTSCGQRGGRDAVYYVDVSSLSDVTVDTLGSDADTVLSVTTDCPSFGGFNQNGCDDDIDDGTNTDSRIWLHRIGPAIGSSTRRIFILVDGFNSSATGGYTVNVQVRSAHADTCSAPISISGGGTMIGNITASPLPIGGSERGSCQTSAEGFEAEAVATFHGSPGGTANFDAFSSDFVPDIYVRQTCGRSDSELDCQKGAGVGGGFNRAQLGVDVTTGTSYFLFVDGATASGGYSVDYQP